MEQIPDDLLQIIFSFLSLRERKDLRYVSSILKSQIKWKDMTTYRLGNLLPQFNNIESKRGNQLILMTNNDMLYKPYETVYDDTYRVHPLFRVCTLKKKCIVERCREKRLGYIYIQIHTPDWWRIRYDDIRTNLLIKRKIPYCLGCFNIWCNLV